MAVDGGAVEIASAYVSLVPSGRGFAGKLDDEVGPGVDAAGVSLGERISSGMFGNLAKSAAVAGVAAGAALGAGVLGAGVALFKIGSTFDDAFDQIRTQTGATGDKLAGLQENFKTVFANVPTDAGSAASAVATLSQKLGLTGEPLTNLSIQLLDLSRITGTDLAANMAATVDVFNSFGIAAADQPTKLDELFRASQATGVGVDQLAATMASAGPNLQQLGLNFEQSAGLVAIFGKAGVDVGAVLPALSKTIVSAAKDGKNAGDVFRDTFAAIKNAPDDTKGAAAAIDTFGAKAGPKLAGLIRQGKLGYEELAAAIANGGDTITGAASDTEDFAEKWGRFKNQVMVGLEPLATKVFGAVGDAMAKIGPKVGPIISTLTGGITALFSAFAAGGSDVTSSGFAGALERIGLIGRSVFNFLADGFKLVFGAFRALVAAFQSGGDDITSGGLAGAFERVGLIGRTVFDTIVGAVKALIGAFKAGGDDVTSGGLAGAFEKIGLFARQAFDLIKGIDFGAIFNGIKDAVEPVIAAALPALIKAFDFVATAVKTVFDLIRDNRETIANVAGIIGGALKVAGEAAGKALSVLGDAFRFLAEHMGLVKAIVIPLVAAWAAYQVVMAGIAVVTGIVSAATAIWTGIQAAFNVVMALNPIGLVVAAIVALVAGVIYAYTHFDSFRAIVDTVWQVLMSVFHWVQDNWPLLLAILLGPFGVAVLVVVKNFDTIRDAIVAVFNWVVDHWQLLLAILTGPIGIAVGIILTHWDTIKSAFSAVKDWIQGRIEDVVGFFVGIPGRVWGAISGLFENIKSGISGAANWVGDRVNDIVSFFTGIPGRIAGSFSGAFDGLSGAFRSGVNAIVRAWNSLPSITLPGVDIGPVHIGGQTIGFPKLPQIAEGGIVTRATLALIGEAGPEAVIPLRSGTYGMADNWAHGGQGETVINVYPSPFADPADVARELAAEQRWQRIGAGV